MSDKIMLSHYVLEFNYDREAMEDAIIKTMQKVQDEEIRKTLQAALAFAATASMTVTAFAERVAELEK